MGPHRRDKITAAQVEAAARKREEIGNRIADLQARTDKPTAREKQLKRAYVKAANKAATLRDRFEREGFRSHLTSGSLYNGGNMAKRRTPAQIRATKKLVAMNKARARKNSAGPKKTLRSRLKARGQMKRGGKALAKWVRSGMPAQRNAPRSGYVVYPGGRHHNTLAQAKAYAKRISAEDGTARVESIATEKVLARYEWGNLKQKNPKKRGRSKAARQMKRAKRNPEPKNKPKGGASGRVISGYGSTVMNSGKPPKGFIKCQAVRVVTKGGKQILQVKR
jgi:hypothetical protein